jgi:hypothetical protein
VLVDRHGDRSDTSQQRAHRVGRVADRGVQHDVTVGPSQPEPLRYPGDEFLRAHARREVAWIDVDAQATIEPSRRGLAERNRADRRWIPALCPGLGKCLHDEVRWWIRRRAHREVDAATIVLLGDRTQLAEAVVRVRRRREAGVRRHYLLDHELVPVGRCHVVEARTNAHTVVGSHLDEYLTVAV